MKELLSPNSVAVIGASNDETKLGGMLVKNMLNAGFKGKLYPINPKGGEIMGLKAYPSVTDVGEPIDLAVVAVKAAPNARIDGVSIQQMVSGQEVILSMIRDPQFGPVISFGLGGIYVEILREISQAHVPMTEQQLDEMIKSTKAYKLMSGARGLPEADIESMKDVIKRMVLIALENPEIHELEINPVIVGLKGKGCWAVDALCTLVKE